MQISLVKKFYKISIHIAKRKKTNSLESDSAANGRGDVWHHLTAAKKKQKLFSGKNIFWVVYAPLGYNLKFLTYLGYTH